MMQVWSWLHHSISVAAENITCSAIFLFTLGHIMPYVGVGAAGRSIASTYQFIQKDTSLLDGEISQGGGRRSLPRVL